ncbi:MAG TPA: OmpH family outer membrane protein [Desulfatiglandales bacterium]|nr:OmpH family outer membrane protein [Desulfatiglandales bacterium]
MKRTLLTLGVISLMGLVFITSTYAADIKIGVIDTQRIMLESKAGSATRALFQKEVQDNNNRLQAKQKEAQAMQEELNIKGKDMTPVVLAEKQEKYSNAIKELTRMKNDMTEDLETRDNELSQKLLKTIGEIVVQYSQKEKFTLILEKNSIVTYDSVVDITDKIIQLYDAAQ